MILRTTAAVLVLGSISDNKVSGFTALQQSTRIRWIQRTVHRISRANDIDDGFLDQKLYRAVANVTNQVSERYQEDITAETQLEQALDSRKQVLQQRRTAPSAYTVQLEFTDLTGLALAPVKSGQIQSTQQLDLQTLEMQNIDTANIDDLYIDPGFSGLVVTRVLPDSAALKAGIRVGHTLAAVSATLGDAAWPQSTIAGLSSALRSRQRLNSWVRLDLSRPALTATTMNQYELTLPRPLGLEIIEQDGFVVVTGFQASASKLARTAIQVGDRLLAVDASWGSTLWPVSTVQGVQSACTSRLPGQAVTLRLERPLENLKSTPLVYSDDLVQPAVSTMSDVTIEQQQEDRSRGDESETLLRRCRTVLTRYAVDRDNQAVSFRGKHAVPGIVADKVVDTVKSAGLCFDAVTLSMVLQAYASVGMHSNVVNTFELATGFASDGSQRAVPTSALEANPLSLTTHTVTALIQAHTKLGNLAAVRRVWAAVSEEGTKDSPGWHRVQPDTTLYNAVLNSFARLCSLESVEKLVAQMKDPSVLGTTPGNLVEKSLATYNTLIQAYARAGQPADAWKVFNSMKVAPDVVTYTSMISVSDDADTEELWYDMLERGVEPDVRAYHARIQALCEKCQWTQATRLVTEMERTRGLSPNSRTYGLLMNAMLPTKPSACLALFESARAADRTHALVTENAHLYTTAITAAAKLANHERALELVARMKADGIKPNLITLTAVMGACLSSKEYGLAADLYRNSLMGSTAVVRDEYATVQGIEALCRDNDWVTAFQQLTCDNGPKLKGKQRMKSYDLIVQAALSHTDYSTAENVVNDLFKNHYIPSKAFVWATVRSLDIMDSPRNVETAGPKFDFLLFILDALLDRNLEVPASLYSAILTLGNKMGDEYRKLASILILCRSLDPTTDNKGSSVIGAWRDLDVDSVDVEALPKISVRVSKREMHNVLRAERAIPSAKSARRR